MLFPSLNADEVDLLVKSLTPAALGNFACCSKAARALAFQEMGCTLERLSSTMNKTELVGRLGISHKQARELPYTEEVKRVVGYNVVSYVYDANVALAELVRNIGWKALSEKVRRRAWLDERRDALRERQETAKRARLAELSAFLGMDWKVWWDQADWSCDEWYDLQYSLQPFIKRALKAPPLKQVSSPRAEPLLEPRRPDTPRPARSSKSPSARRTRVAPRRSRSCWTAAPRWWLRLAERYAPLAPPRSRDPARPALAQLPDNEAVRGYEASEWIHAEHHFKIVVDNIREEEVCASHRVCGVSASLAPTRAQERAKERQRLKREREAAEERKAAALEKIWLPFKLARV